MAIQQARMQVKVTECLESCAHFEKKGAGARDGVFPGPHRNGSKDTMQGSQILTRGPSTLKTFCRENKTLISWMKHGSQIQTQRPDDNCHSTTPPGP